jgi:hypothetical protein
MATHSWKKAIRLTILGTRFQHSRGVLTTGSINGKSVLERLKQVGQQLVGK